MNNWTPLFSVMIASSTLIGCGGNDNDDSSPASETAQVTIPFSARSGTDEISCDTTLTNLGTGGVNGEMVFLGYYVHDVTFVSSTGAQTKVNMVESAFQDSANDVAFLNFRDKDESCSGNAELTNKSLTVEVDSSALNDVAKVTFKVGVPHEVNHDSSWNSQHGIYASGDYQWNWQAGRKFMRLDVKPATPIARGSDTGDVWNFHLGSTGCMYSTDVASEQNYENLTCANPNRPTIELSDFMVANNRSSTIVLDYNELVASVDFATDNVNTGATQDKFGCMSFPKDDECVNMFATLGYSYNVDSPNGQTTADLTQSVFSIENK